MLALAAKDARAYPAWWRAQAACIHRYESTDWHRTLDWQGRRSRDHGGFQIDVATWAAYVPPRWPADPAWASPAQQRLVAWRIWRANGRRWGGSQWPNTAHTCGVR